MMPKTMPMVAKSAVFGQGGLSTASCCKPRTAEGQGIEKRILAMAGIAVAMAVAICNSSSNHRCGRWSTNHNMKDTHAHNPSLCHYGTLARRSIRISLYIYKP